MTELTLLWLLVYLGISIWTNTGPTRGSAAFVIFLGVLAIISTVAEAF